MTLHKLVTVAAQHRMDACGAWHGGARNVIDLFLSHQEFMMTATALIIFLLIGAIAGWLAGLLVRGFGFGLLGNIVIGIVGALLAGWLLPALGVSFMIIGPIVTSIVYAMIGAIVLLVIIGLIKRA
ncbi:GlsB/YeaQ/YmgE family stress response membrane protein [Rhodanobacter sp. UC4437_H4]